MDEPRLLPRMQARKWANSDKVTYRYSPTPGKWIGLGTNYGDAIRYVLAQTQKAPDHGTLGWVWSQWIEHKRYQRLAKVTQTDYVAAWAQINKAFGKRPAASVTSTEVARYVHITRADSPRRADIEKTLMSNLFRHGILLGVNSINPTIGVEPHGGSESPDLPDAAVLARFLAWLDKQTPQRRRIGFTAEYASLTGNRRCEFLTLSRTQVDEAAGVVRTFRAKQRGKKKQTVVEVVTITPALSALLKRIYATIPEGCLYLFPNEDGNAYTDRGWKTLWQRCVLAAIKDGVLTEAQRFNFHALRHHYTTVHKAREGSLPNLHASEAVTARVYDHTTEEKRTAL